MYRLAAEGILIGLLAVSGTFALHEYKQVAIQKSTCTAQIVAMTAQWNQQAAAAQAKANRANLQSLERQLANLQSDAEAAAGREQHLRAKLHDEQEVLHHVQAQTKAGDCLNQHVPRALIDSLRSSHQGATQPPRPGGGIS